MLLAMASQVVLAGAEEAETVGLSVGRPQTLMKERHLLALDCGSACGGRCAKASVQDRCLKYCGLCCKQCQCVPSGTYGNKDQCPCYRDLENSKGKPKCP